MSDEEKQRQRDLDSLVEIYRTAMQLGTWGKYVLYIVATVLGILLSLKKLRQ